MADTPIAPKALSASENPNERRLESWGEIALYLKRDIRTVQRYEKNEGLPVHRMRIGKGDQVYAFPSELDQWIRDRQPKPDDDLKEVNNAEDDRPNNNGVDKTGPDTKSDPAYPAAKRVLWKWVAMAAGAAIILALAVFFFVPNPGLPKQAASSKTLLFVRPFAGLGMGGDQIFVKGLRDETIVHLGKIDPSQLGVFGPTTSDEYGSLPYQKLREILHADYVLEGSVRVVNDQLRINATMVSTRDGSQVWANSYTGSRDEVLKFQDEITTDVANKITNALPQVYARGKLSEGSANPEAYEAYRNGRVYLLDRDLGRSLTAFQKALSIDPKYPPALAGLATTYLLLGETPNDAMPPAMAIPKARQAANEALAIDQNEADALCVLANIAQGFDHDLPEAERLFREAIRLDPSNVTAHEWYGYYLALVNRMPDAEKEMSRALEIDPASPLLNTTTAELKYYQRDYDAAIRQANKTLDQYPGFFLARFWLGSSYREKKLYPLALKQFHLAREESNDLPCMVQAEANAMGMSGDQKGATELLRLLQATAETKYVPALYFAGIYEGLGERDKVFNWLDKAYEERNDRLPYLGIDPIADPLRSDLRYKLLMKKVGVSATLQGDSASLQ